MNSRPTNNTKYSTYIQLCVFFQNVLYFGFYSKVIQSLCKKYVFVGKTSVYIIPNAKLVCSLAQRNPPKCSVEYSGPRLIRPPLRNGKSGIIRGVASREGYIRYNYTFCSVKLWPYKRAGLW